MGNYEYIIASLPAITLDWKFPGDASFGAYVDEIKRLGGSADVKAIDRLLAGFDDASLNKDFYVTAIADKNRFLREYFTFDLNVRNGKARFLNKAFGRPVDQDTIAVETGSEFAEAGKLEAALAIEDLLARERALDTLTWDKISEITTFDYFDIEAVLGFIAKLHLIDRWFSLDESAGREMFSKLVNEVRGTYKGVEFDARKTEKQRQDI